VFLLGCHQNNSSGILTLLYTFVPFRPVPKVDGGRRWLVAASTMNTPQHWYIKQRGGLYYLRYLRDGPMRDTPEVEVQVVKYKVSDDMLIVFAKDDLSGFVLEPAQQHADHPRVFSELMESVFNALERHTA
jgi:hypothetical protein